MLKASLNGARPAGAHRFLPLTPEARLSDERAARRLNDSGLADQCLRVLLEPQSQDLAMALGMVDRIEAVLDSSGIGCPRLLHGTDATAWPLLDQAARRGYDARI